MTSFCRAFIISPIIIELGILIAQYGYPPAWDESVERSLPWIFGVCQALVGAFMCGASLMDWIKERGDDL